MPRQTFLLLLNLRGKIVMYNRAKPGDERRLKPTDALADAFYDYHVNLFTDCGPGKGACRRTYDY